MLSNSWYEAPVLTDTASVDCNRLESVQCVKVRQLASWGAAVLLVNSIGNFLVLPQGFAHSCDEK
jgi:hypothetical protein